jgi:hypothetical protein
VDFYSSQGQQSRATLHLPSFGKRAFGPGLDGLILFNPRHLCFQFWEPIITEMQRKGLEVFRFDVTQKMTIFDLSLEKVKRKITCICV